MSIAPFILFPVLAVASLPAGYRRDVALASSHLRDSALSPALIAEAPDDPAHEDAIITEVALNAWVLRIRPSIEVLAGRTFTVQVDIRVVDRDALANLIAPSIAEDLRAADPKLNESILYVRSMSQAYGLGNRTLGLYSRKDRVVYAAPENIRRLSPVAASDPLMLGRMVRLVIAHELIHALQHQHAPDQHAPADPQTGLARSAVIEGHAVLATDQLAKRLNWLDANAAALTLVAAAVPERGGSASSGGGGSPRTVAPPPDDLGGAPVPIPENHFIYLRGRDFMAHHTGKDPDVAWRILAAPPPSVSQIFRPETYTPAPEPPRSRPPQPAQQGSPQPEPSGKP